MSCSWLVLINSKFKIFINLELKKNFFIFLFYFIDFFFAYKTPNQPGVNTDPRWCISPGVFRSIPFPQNVHGERTGPKTTVM